MCPTVTQDQDPLLEDASAKTRQQIVEEAFLKDLETQGEMLGLSRDMWTKMQSPARYLGNELGAFHKQWESVDVRMALVCGPWRFVSRRTALGRGAECSVGQRGTGGCVRGLKGR